MVKQKIFDRAVVFLLCLMTLFVLSPILLTLFNSLREGARPYVDFYLWKPWYLRALMISLTVSVTSTAGALIVSSLAAFVLSKIHFRGGVLIFYLYIIVMMMPFQVTMLPQYITLKTLSLYNTLWALILPSIFSPLPVFFLTQTLKSFPNELIEAAKLETSSIPVMLYKVVVPSLRPGIVCIGMITFTEAWNAVVEPLTFLENEKLLPLSVVLSQITTDNVFAFAMIVIFLIPPFLLFSVFDSEIINGIGEYRLK